MSTVIHGNADPEVQSLKEALGAYEVAHPGAVAALYRQNSASIRLRVIDSRFESMTKSRRHAEVWDFLAARVPEDTLADVSLVLAIAPKELRDSFANFEFEQPRRPAYDRGDETPTEPFYPSYANIGDSRGRLAAKFAHLERECGRGYAGLKCVRLKS